MQMFLVPKRVFEKSPPWMSIVQNSKRRYASIERVHRLRSSSLSPSSNKIVNLVQVNTIPCGID
jgi:hypothetical protein